MRERKRTAKQSAANALAMLEAALRDELTLTAANFRLRRPLPARGWPAFLSLALIALTTEHTRDALALAWQRAPQEIDAALQQFAALGWIDGFGTPQAAPSAAGYAVIAEQLIATGRLASPWSAM